MKQQLSSPSFADLLVGHRKVKQTFFSQIDKIIDWNPIRGIIEIAYTKGNKATGPRAMTVLCCSRPNSSVLGMDLVTVRLRSR